jgi:purine-cytosine permease-like protein
MNKTQRSAWYGVLLSFLLAGIVVFDFLDTRVGWPMKLLVAILWGGLLLAPVYLLQRKKRFPGVDMDERDRETVKKALLVSFISLVVILGAAFVTAFFTLGLTRTVSITMDGLSAMVYYVLVVFVLVLSLAVLVQYGRRAGDG